MTWRLAVETQPNNSQRLKEAIRPIDEKLDPTDPLAPAIKRLKENQFAMQYISYRHKSDFHKLGNDATHPKFKPAVWKQAIEHMTNDGEQRKSWLVLLDLHVPSSSV